ncbi:MAG: 2-octaprenyl-6-methoxyphenyl hydroxylase [Candidatus Parabeggiatoa sp. nov. 2]|nr:MAG: 2-octaprenyl-6-methoxyphenyl hydroxylase [Beggiatoa sp. 4572_84]RKZ61344.1 MAG: 2-octaprenyl-6-methoxyphenyl hydroxylase [Gammaproteobacteria bacterium]
MAEKQIYDIIIVGGGLVGASLACALRTSSLKIAIIEAAPWFTDSRPPSYDDRIIALNYASHRIFSGIGVWDKIAPEATAIKHIHVSDQGHFGFTRLNSHVLGAPALGYVVSARHLGQTFQETLAPSSIDIFAPAQLVQLINLEQAVEVQIKLDNQLHTLKTRLLVAADGGHSKVRQLLGLTALETDYGQTAVIANVTLEYPHKNTAYERFTPSGPLALLPRYKNDCSLVWTCVRDNTDEVMALDDQSFLNALQQQFGWRLGRFIQVGQRHAYPLRLIRVQQHTRPRAVVIGNAAHTLHPVAGQGLNLGLRDVASLAESVMESVKAGEDVGSEATLQRYTAWQLPDQQRAIALTHKLVQVFCNTFGPLVVARNFGLLVTDALLPLKKQFLRQMAGLTGHPSRLVRGLPL